MFQCETNDTTYGYESPDDDLNREQRLAIAVIIRAHRDYLSFWKGESDIIARPSDAHDAYKWVQQPLKDSPTPFSFQWCAEAAYRSRADAIIHALRYAMRFPVPLAAEALRDSSSIATARAEVLKYQTQHCNRGKA